MRPIVRHSALALLLASAALRAAGADDMGTLFTTPEERARLDKLRRGEPIILATPQAARDPRKPALTGYVQRSDGRNTIWIDGRPVVTASPSPHAVLEPNMVQPPPSPPPRRPDDTEKEER